MISDKLTKIQTKLSVPKNLYNSFGRFYYRNAEGICEAVKPYLEEQNCSLTLTDDIEEIGGRVYVKATATLTDNEEGKSISTTAFARENDAGKGNETAQVTGTTSSYARKYALNGLFLLDDNKDADTEEAILQARGKEPITSKELGTVEAMLRDKEALRSYLLKGYELRSFKDMTAEQYLNFMKTFSQREELFNKALENAKAKKSNTAEEEKKGAECLGSETPEQKEEPKEEAKKQTVNKPVKAAVKKECAKNDKRRGNK